MSENGGGPLTPEELNAAREAWSTAPPPQSVGAPPVAASEGEFDAISLEDDDTDSGEALENPTGAMAPITVVPTSSTNPQRPRTVAAGYARELRTITVIFRDGTPYNYYEVSPLEWANFKRARSKGRFIGIYLDSKPRGFPAADAVDIGQLSILQAIASRAQVITGGVTAGQSKASRRGGAGTYKPGNLGGSTRRRRRIP